MQERLDILDGNDPSDKTDQEVARLLPLRQTCQPFDIDAIWNNPQLPGLGPALQLIIAVHAGNRDKRIGDLIGNLLHKAIDIQPPLLKEAQALIVQAVSGSELAEPGGLRNLHLAFPRINAMLRHDQGAARANPGQGPKQATEAGTHGMVDARRRERRLQKAKNGQIGKTKRPEKIDKRLLRRIERIEFDQQIPAFARIQQIGGGQSGQTGLGDQLPKKLHIIRPTDGYSLMECLKSLPGSGLAPTAFEPLYLSDIVNKNLAKLEHIGRQDIERFALGIGASANMDDCKGQAGQIAHQRMQPV